MKENKIVMPGEQLSTSEEMLSGEGTFEDEGIIRAARIGQFVVDEKHRKAIVKPLTSTPVVVKKGDTVLGEIKSVKPSMVIVEVLHVIGKNRRISGDTNGTIHVSEISSSYVKNPSEAFKLGDIIKARVTQAKPSLQLLTKDRNLGVIKALCVKCRHPLVRNGISLECKKCGNKEKRKNSMEYGNIILEKF